MPKTPKKQRESDSPIYSAWKAMKRRCYNPNDLGFKNHGAKGTKVCPEWIDNYQAFKQDMGPRPKGYTLFRKDKSKDFSPSNCKWASSLEQGQFNSQSEQKGVTFRPPRLRKNGVVEKAHWQSRIRIDGKIVHLGCFDNEEDALVTYELAREAKLQSLGLAEEGDV